MIRCKALKGGILGIAIFRFFRGLINSFKNCYTPAHLWHSKTSKGNIQGFLFVFLNLLYLAPQFWKKQESLRPKRAASAVTGVWPVITSLSRGISTFGWRQWKQHMGSTARSGVCNSLHITSWKTKGLFLAWWLISVAIAISNTYKNRVEPKCAKTLAKVLKRQSNICGVWQSFNGEGCQINLCVVIAPEVAVGITGVVSKYVVWERFLHPLKPALCEWCHFINTVAAAFIFHVVSACRMFKDLLKTLSLLFTSPAPCEY